MRIVVAGAGGLIGSALLPALRGSGHDVLRLVRRAPAGPGEHFWDPAAGRIDPGVIEAADVVINLAGCGIADKRWTAARRREIRDSRILSTAVLARAIGGAKRRPRLLLSASAVGIYGGDPAKIFTETDPPGGGFLAGVCREWESEAAAVEASAVRFHALRFGIVLAPDGGVLGRMLPLFRAGLGGRLGGGRQWMSWIGIGDAVAAVLALAGGPPLPEGVRAVNIVSPQPVASGEFTRTLARVLHRPALLPLPAPVLRLAAGGMADELLLQGQRVRPAVLEEAGFRWGHPDLEGALRFLLGGGR